MRHIDLFSGIGGFALAATWVWGDDYENVGHSEIESYPCKVYHNHFPESECLGDITKIDWSRFQDIDLVTGGFPCQPHSVAGKRQGEGDKRDLWSECVRAIRELRPRFALFENVAGLFTSNGGRFFQRVLTDISESGYDCEWQVLSAQEVGAWHRRERVWITAYRECLWKLQSQRGKQNEWGWVSDVCENVPDPALPDGKEGNTRSGEVQLGRGRTGKFGGIDWWATEPNVGRVANGIPSRVDRLKGLGNAIVPQVAAVIMQAIKANQSLSLGSQTRNEYRHQ
jgi:DNA (cytosine-5)-methyltransferase 1